MKFKTLKRLIILFTLVSIVNATIVAVVIIFGYGALLDFVDAPFAFICPGIIGILISTIISYTVGNGILKAYKDFKRHKK